MRIGSWRKEVRKGSTLYYVKSSKKNQIKNPGMIVVTERETGVGVVYEMHFWRTSKKPYTIGDKPDFKNIFQSRRETDTAILRIQNQFPEG